jgi:hypothetical protein
LDNNPLYSRYPLNPNLFHLWKKKHNQNSYQNEHQPLGEEMNGGKWNTLFDITCIIGGTKTIISSSTESHTNLKEEKIKTYILNVK